MCESHKLPYQHENTNSDLRVSYLFKFIDVKDDINKKNSRSHTPTFE